jgi:hypothetical protein
VPALTLRNLVFCPLNTWAAFIKQCLCEGISRSVNLMRICPYIFAAPYASVCVGYGFINTVVCIVIGSKSMTCFQLCWSISTACSYWAYNAWKWNSNQNSPAFIGFLWWGYCWHNYFTSLGEKTKGQWRNIGPEWPAAVWKACHHNSQYEQAETLTSWFKKIDEFLRDRVEKLNIGLPSVNKIIAGLGYKKIMCLMDVT